MRMQAGVCVIVIIYINNNNIIYRDMIDESKDRWLQEAIQYVRDNKTWTEEEESLALDYIDMNRCPIEQASDHIYCAIHDLLNEWSEDNDLDEYWWWEYINEDDVFWELMKD